jgi:hypothetical protein
MAETRNTQATPQPQKPAPPEGWPNDGNKGQQPAHQPVYQTDNTPQRQGQPGQLEEGKPNEPGKPNFPNQTGYQPQRPGEEPRSPEHTTADPNADNNAGMTGSQGAERQGDQKK